jgi:hypothetical protein
MVELHEKLTVATSESIEMADFFRNVHCVMGLPIARKHADTDEDMQQKIEYLANAIAEHTEL